KKKKRDTSVNKTAEVLSYAAANKGAKPKAISEALTAKGVPVSAAYVSSIISTNKRKGRKKPAAKKAGRPASNGAVSLDSIVAAAKFIKASGGIDNAKAALKAAEVLAASF
ncbi:MAG: hypothetical protein RIC55_01620, partial [Pirellulaceae bacterium]